MQIESRTDRTGYETGSSTPPIPARPLSPDYRAKPWGRRDGLGAPEQAQPLGEVVFDATDAGLVVKWIQTSEALSIQVHPRHGPDRKHEWWYVTDARPGACLYLGLKEPATQDALRRAAGDGTLPDMLHRIEPAAGDSFMVEAGTIHALGPGLTVVEVQEPSDVTWRLYDHGRQRELHLEQGLDAAILEPRPLTRMPGDAIPFRISHELLDPGQRVMLVAPRASVAVVRGSGTLGGALFEANQCWTFGGSVCAQANEATELIVAEPHEADAASDTAWRARQ